MESFKDCTKEEINELLAKGNEALNKFRKENKINSILLFGIGEFWNNVITNIKDIPKVTKLFSDTNKQSLEKFNQNNSILFLQDYKLSPTDTGNKNNYSRIYKHLMKNKEQITEKIKNYDYIIICTLSDEKEYNCLAEAVADICAQSVKRFMICCTARYNLFLPAFLNLSKRISNRFINKMKKKNYLLNEINPIDTSFTCDKIVFEYKGENYQSFGQTNTDLTFTYEFNIEIFADIFAYNIINLLGI